MPVLRERLRLREVPACAPAQEPQVLDRLQNARQVPRGEVHRVQEQHNLQEGVRHLQDQDAEGREDLPLIRGSVPPPIPRMVLSHVPNHTDKPDEAVVQDVRQQGSARGEGSVRGVHNLARTRNTLSFL